jgi:hypothetical protein
MDSGLVKVSYWPAETAQLNEIRRCAILRCAVSIAAQCLNMECPAAQFSAEAQFEPYTFENHMVYARFTAAQPKKDKS